METEKLEENANKKRVEKNCDMLIANNLFTAGAGFKTDTNVVTLFKGEEKIHLDKMTKEQLGVKILETLMEIEEGKTC